MMVAQQCSAVHKRSEMKAAVSKSAKEASVYRYRCRYRCQCPLIPCTPISPMALPTNTGTGPATVIARSKRSVLPKHKLNVFNPKHFFIFQNKIGRTHGFGFRDSGLESIRVHDQSAAMQLFLWKILFPPKFQLAKRSVKFEGSFYCFSSLETRSRNMTRRYVCTAVNKPMLCIPVRIFV